MCRLGCGAAAPLYAMHLLVGPAYICARPGPRMAVDNELLLRGLAKNKKSLRKGALLASQAIKANPIAVALIEKFSEGDLVDMEELTKSLVHFITSVRLEDKLRFLFGCFDADSDGCVTNTELFELLKLLNRGVLEDWKLQNIVDRTFAEIGDYRTKMGYEEFCALIQSNNKNLMLLLSCNE